MGVRTLLKSADYQGPEHDDLGIVFQRSSICRTIQRRTSKFCDAILNDAEFAEKYGELGNIYDYNGVTGNQRW